MSRWISEPGAHVTVAARPAPQWLVPSKGTTAHAFNIGTRALCGLGFTCTMNVPHAASPRCRNCERHATANTQETPMRNTATNTNRRNRTTNPEGTTAMPKATTTAKSTARRAVSKVAKSTTLNPTPEQKARAATGTMSMATKAVAELARLVKTGASESRVQHQRDKAADAIALANGAAKAAGQKVPFRSVTGYLKEVISENRTEREAAQYHPANPPKAEKPSRAAKSEPKAASKPAAQRPPLKRETVKEPTPKRAPLKAGTVKPRARKITLHRIETLNRADGSVDGHAGGCADIAKVAKRERLDRSGEQQVSSKHAAYLDYNADFLPECEGCDGHDVDAEHCAHAYNINWLPCADHVPAFDGEKPKRSRAAKAADARGEAQSARSTAKAAIKREQRSAAAKPAAKKASSTEAQALSTKVVALRDYLDAAGWSTGVRIDDDRTVVVAAEREGERLVTTFIDNKVGPDVMPTYTRIDGSTVKLRNASAVKQQADKDAAKRPVKAQRTVVVRTRSVTPEVEQAEASRALDIDVKNAELDDLQKYLNDLTVWWRLSSQNGGGIVEARIWKVTKVIEGKSGRCVEFIEAMPTKRGWTAGGYRTVALKNLRLK